MWGEGSPHNRQIYLVLHQEGQSAEDGTSQISLEVQGILNCFRSRQADSKLHTKMQRVLG